MRPEVKIDLAMQIVIQNGVSDNTHRYAREMQSAAESRQQVNLRARLWYDEATAVKRSPISTAERRFEVRAVVQPILQYCVRTRRSWSDSFVAHVRSGSTSRTQRSRGV